MRGERQEARGERVLLVLAVVLLAAGCASTPRVKEGEVAPATVRVPINIPDDPAAEKPD